MTGTTRDLPDELRRFLEADPERMRAFEDAAWYEGLRRRLVSLRRERGLSQKEVADRAGCHQSEISRLENGLGDRTRLGSIRRYVEACDSRLDVLVGETPPAVWTLSSEQPSWGTFEGVPSVGGLVRWPGGDAVRVPRDDTEPGNETG